MKAAEMSASRAIADWTPLAVVWRSLITADIDTFISDVSMTKTNIAMAKRRARRGFPSPASSTPDSALALMTIAPPLRDPYGRPQSELQSLQSLPVINLS